MSESELIPLSDAANFKELGKRQRKSAPPAAKPDLKRTISAKSNEILDDVYQFLGGVQGSMIYWRNHEDVFREQVEAKIMLKRATADIDVQEAAAAGKSVFQLFIQNNGLTQKQAIEPQKDDDAEEATVVTEKPQ